MGDLPGSVIIATIVLVVCLFLFAAVMGVLMVVGGRVVVEHDLEQLNRRWEDVSVGETRFNVSAEVRLVNCHGDDDVVRYRRVYGIAGTDSIGYWKGVAREWSAATERRVRGEWDVQCTTWLHPW
jgi:hypothetical protein